MPDPSLIREHAHTLIRRVHGQTPVQAALYRALLERHAWLRDTTEALRDVLDGAEVGVCEYDLRSGSSVRSVAHDRIFGYDHALADWTFEMLLDHVAPEHRDLARSRFTHLLVAGDEQFDCRIVRADGSQAWIRAVAHVVRNGDRTPARIVSIVADVSRPRQQEDFISTLAHELRQPLAALLSAVEVVCLGPRTRDSQRATDIMRRQIGQMNRVVEDLMDATRLSRGKVTILKERIDLRDLIQDAALDATTAAATRGHELVVTTASAPLWVDADPQRLRQVLSNLLGNAVKYTDPGGRISVVGDRAETTVRARIADTGRGIPHDALPHIFDLFSQVSSFEEGAGIGLSVAREIVELHGGSIEARSEGPGRGSEFVVRLPAPWEEPVGVSRAERRSAASG